MYTIIISRVACLIKVLRIFSSHQYLWQSFLVEVSETGTLPSDHFLAFFKALFQWNERLKKIRSHSVSLLYFGLAVIMWSTSQSAQLCLSLPTELVGGYRNALVRHTFCFPRISGQTAEGINIKLGGYIHYSTPKICYAPKSFCCVVASDWWNSFHAFQMPFANKMLIRLGSNFMSQLIMGLPRPD